MDKTVSKVEEDYFAYNAMLNLLGDDQKIQFDKDRIAVRQFFLQHVNNNMVFFHNLKEKLEYLIDNQYYETEVIDLYSYEQIKTLFKSVYRYKFRFKTFQGAYKFYKQYALMTFDGKRYLERFEDRVSMTALYLGDGDIDLAMQYAREIITGVYQPATPTFLNAARKQRGEPVSCFLMSISDDLDAIGRSVNSVLQLSKRGGGVAVCLTDIRETGAPIKGIEGVCSGIRPIMKIYEDAFSYANQLGARDGSGAVYIHACHPDIMLALDTKRENADEKIRIKTLSLGIVIPDILFELAANNEPLYLFSPYDVKRVYGIPLSEIHVTKMYREMVANKEIKKKKISALKLMETIATIQAESGYPYLMFEDVVNAANPIHGWVKMSNLCVVPETKLFTDQGELPIVFLADQLVNVWNGLEWSEVTVKKTGTDQRIWKVTTTGGKVLECTEYHKWYLKDSENLTEVRTNELKQGDELIVWSTPDSVTDKSVLNSDIVLSVTITNRRSDTYCLTEPKRGMAVFNGILTGNCSEILQVQTDSEMNPDGSYKVVGKDVSCNLGSTNAVNLFESPDFGLSVELATRALTKVSDLSNIECVPSIDHGNKISHAIGLGMMNLHGFFGKYRMHYGSPESLDFTNLFFMAVNFHSIRTSCLIAQEKKETFLGFEQSKYADGSYFDLYVNGDWLPKTEQIHNMLEQQGFKLPTNRDWSELRSMVMEHGLYNQYRMAVPPTGSISYVNNATASIHPIAAKIEARKEGKTGRSYFPAPHMSNDNIEYYRDAYEIGPYKVIDVYAAATPHVDQGLSLTMFFPDNVTTRDINKAQIYARSKGIKTIYYIRLRKSLLAGTEVEGCVSCAV